MRRPVRHWIAIIAYILLAVAMTWPLVLNFSTAIPGVQGDATSYLWALGWAKTAVADLHVNPFRSDYVYYPLGGATQLMWAVSLIGFVSIPLQYLFGLVATHNLLYLAATVLTAYGTFLLAEYIISDFRFQISDLDPSPLHPYATFLLADFIGKYLKRNRSSFLAPFTAGLIFAFAPLRLGYGLSFLNLFNTELIPFFVLFLLRATRQNSWRDALLAGVFFGLNAYIDFQIAAFLALFALIYGAYVLLADWRAARQAVLHWAVAGVVAAGLAAPMVAILANDFAAEGGNYIGVYKLDYSAARSYDLTAYVVPNARSTLYASAPLKIVGVNASKPGDVTPLSPDFQSFVGYVPLALAAYAAVRRWKKALFWLLTALLFAVFSLGPVLHVLGNATTLPLPYVVLHEIPFLNNIRIPMRYGIMVAFAIAILAALAIDDLQARLANSNFRFKRVAFGLLPILILLEFVALPYPVQPTPISSVYTDIAKVPGDFTVLEIPSFHWRWASVTEAYQPIDGKRILRAYTNRIAPDLAEYFGTRGTPIVLHSLRVLEGMEPGKLTSGDFAEDKKARDQIIQFYDLRYAVVHRSFLTPDQARNIQSYLQDVLGAHVAFDDGDTVAYELPQPTLAADPVHIDLRQDIAQMYAGRGWHFEYPPADWENTFKYVWAIGAQSEIYFTSNNGADRVMTLHAHAETPQHVGLSLNGQHIGDITITTDWKDYRITLPASVLLPKMNVVRLTYDTALTETVGVTTIDIQ